MHRLLPFALIASLAFLNMARAADDDEALSPKQALQALNDYIGDWHGNGSPDSPRADPRDTWRESVGWTWRFKGNDVWLAMKVKDGKYFKTGELRFLPEKKHYQLRIKTAEGDKQVFEGEIRKDILTLDRVDPKTRETQRLKMNIAADGARFVYRYEYRPRGRTIFYRGYQVGFTKEGESLGATEVKVECVVSGGLGKIPVSYDGKTYFVCCSGCLEAFKENPAKYVKEYEARKAGKK